MVMQLNNDKKLTMFRIVVGKLLTKYGYDVRPLKPGYDELVKAGFKSEKKQLSKYLRKTTTNRKPTRYDEQEVDSMQTDIYPINDFGPLMKGLAIS